MRPRLRKALLTTHVVSSVGWLGVVVTYLGVAIPALVSTDAAMVRGLYQVMRQLTWNVVIPISTSALVTGIVLAVAGSWGLTRHWWVLIKLTLNVLSSAMLVLYTISIERFAALTTNNLAVLHDPAHVNHAGLALIVLLVATVLGIYKPKARTRWGRKTAETPASTATLTPAV